MISLSLGIILTSLIYSALKSSLSPLNLWVVTAALYMTHPVIYLLFQTQVSLFVPARKDPQSIPLLSKPTARMLKTTISLCSFLWSAFSSCLICLIFFIDTLITPIAVVPSLLVVEALLHCLQLLLAVWSSGPFMAVPYLCWCKLYSTNSKLMCWCLFWLSCRLLSCRWCGSLGSSPSYKFSWILLSLSLKLLGTWTLFFKWLKQSSLCFSFVVWTTFLFPTPMLRITLLLLLPNLHNCFLLLLSIYS